MKTSIMKYEKGKVRLTLVGVSHIGKRSYFNKLSKICNLSEVVLYELVKRKKKKIGSKLYVAMLEIINEGRKEGLVFQYPAMKFNKKWINADIRFEDLQQISETADLLDSDEAIEEVRSKKEALRVSIKFLPVLTIIKKYMSDRILIEMRNCICLQELSKQMKKHKRISIIYGEAHLRHFDKMLRAIGFVRMKKIKIDTGL